MDLCMSIIYTAPLYITHMVELFGVFSLLFDQDAGLHFLILSGLLNSQCLWSLVQSAYSGPVNLI